MQRRYLISTAAILLLATLLIGRGTLAQPGEISPQLAAVSTSVAPTISYQGVLTDDTGEPLDGLHDLDFRLYNDPGGGTQLWSQSFVNLLVQDGNVQAYLDIDATDFDGQALWLEVVVDGQTLSPRQEIMPAPYALSLRPGAEIIGEEYYGLSSITSNSYGLYGVSSSDSFGAGVLGENSAGVGDGVQGGSNGRAGVAGFGESADSYGGYFLSTGDGVYAAGGGDWNPDVVLGVSGDDTAGVLATDLTVPSSDIYMVANDSTTVTLDVDDDEDGIFTVVGSDWQALFAVEENGLVWAGRTLRVESVVSSQGHKVVDEYIDSDGARTIDVPEYCLDGLCEVYVATDATMGAYGPGMLDPVTYRQNTSNGNWLGGPSLCIAGVCFSDGVGRNGDGVSNSIFVGGETNGGGYVHIVDDYLGQSSPDQWTIVFNGVPGELTWAEIWIVPIGRWDDQEGVGG